MRKAFPEEEALRGVGLRELEHAGGPDVPGERHSTVETQPKQRSGGQGCGPWRGRNVVI